MSTGVGGWFVKSDFTSPLGPSSKSDFSSKMSLSSRPSVAKIQVYLQSLYIVNEQCTQTNSDNTDIFND